MSSLTPVPFNALPSSDLELGRVYCGGPQPHVGADPLPYLLGVGNSGGIRYRNAKGATQAALCVLFSTGAVSEWPDEYVFDHLFYYGDQRTPGKDIHDTALRGNLLLANVAQQMRSGDRGRASVPPFFFFTKASRRRDVTFEGLFVPASESEWLTVESRETRAGKFTNYRAELAPLSIERISRSWLLDVHAGSPHGSTAPQEWLHWVETGTTDGPIR